MHPHLLVLRFLLSLLQMLLRGGGGGGRDDFSGGDAADGVADVPPRRGGEGDPLQQAGPFSRGGFDKGAVQERSLVLQK